MKKKVCILGASGSIGKNSLDVIKAHPDKFELTGAAVYHNLDLLDDLKQQYPGIICAAVNPQNTSHWLQFTGQTAAEDLVRALEADIVVNGIAGAAGFLPSLAAVKTGARLALANKETVVMAWPLIQAEAQKHGSTIIPVDSEHSAIFHLLDAHGRAALDEIVLTASGGPFRQWSKEQLEQVTVAQALAHPTWRMGGKITIDSATLANKGLEVIEAVRLFDIAPEKVAVIVHPQSKVHSLIRLKDGSLYAQISQPDMRVPIHNALFWPEVTPCPFGALNLAGETLTFEEPNREAFPLLPLAYQAAKKSGLYPAAYNAANEVAVEAFINRGLLFTEIATIVQAVLELDWSCTALTVDTILAGDAAARIAAAKTVSMLEGK